MRFTREETPTIMSGRVVRWRLASSDTRSPFDGEISASRDGVLIQGRWPVFSDPEAIVEVKAILDEAQREHERMRERARRGLWGRG